MSFNYTLEPSYLCGFSQNSKCQYVRLLLTCYYRIIEILYIYVLHINNLVRKFIGYYDFSPKTILYLKAFIWKWHKGFIRDDIKQSKNQLCISSCTRLAQRKWSMLYANSLSCSCQERTPSTNAEPIPGCSPNLTGYLHPWWAQGKVTRGTCINQRSFHVSVCTQCFYIHTTERTEWLCVVKKSSIKNHVSTQTLHEYSTETKIKWDYKYWKEIQNHRIKGKG